MKTKSIVPGIVTASAILMLLSTLQLGARGLVSTQQTITFDSIETDTEGVPANNGYAGLAWDNFYVLDGVDYGEASGYQIGVASPYNVAYNAYGDPASILSPDGRTFFILTSANMTAAWQNNLRVEIKGYLFNRVVYDVFVTLSNDHSTVVNFPKNLVNRVTFADAEGTQIVFDNVKTTIFHF